MSPKESSFNLGIWKNLDYFEVYRTPNGSLNIVMDLSHLQELVNTEHALQLVIQGIDKGITNDILAMEIRQALHPLGEIIRRWADRQVR
jgi:tRNA U34 5-carboxymethylaminomethyl modifying GTPase MnmE/TrmE